MQTIAVGLGLGSRLGERTRVHLVAAAAAAVEQAAPEGLAGWTVAAVAASGHSQSVGQTTAADQRLGVDEEVQPGVVGLKLQVLVLLLLLAHCSGCCSEDSGWLAAGAGAGWLLGQSRELSLGEAWAQKQKQQAPRVATVPLVVVKLGALPLAALDC